MNIEHKKRLILEIILWLLTLLVFIPYLLVLVTSLKDGKTAGLFQLSFPDVFHFENYLTVWKEGNVPKGLFNSFIIAIPTCLISLMFSAFMSFFLARVKTRLSKFIYMFVVMGMTAPLSIVTTFLLLKDFGLLNTQSGVILVQSALEIPFVTFIMVGFIEGVPKEMDEAATLDGCGGYKMFLYVILPLLKPVFVTTLVLAFMDSWNDAQGVLFFLNDWRFWTMPLNIFRFYRYYHTEWNYIFGSVFLATLPVLIVYLFAQKYIIEGMTAGAVKE
jgi:raffinose/stachyose/melibiose transport system permease protein